MKRMRFFARNVLMGLIGASACACLVACYGSPSTRDFNVCGTVKDTAGVPVEDAKVVIEYDVSGKKDGFTSPDGDYIIHFSRTEKESMQNPDLQLIFSKDGYESCTKPLSVDLSDNRSRDYVVDATISEK